MTGFASLRGAASVWRARMSGMKWVMISLMVFALACSGSSEEQSSTENLSAQQLIEDCVSTDLNGLADLYNTLLNLLSNTDGAPVPESNLLAGILAGGVIPWTLDLDNDGVPDISGDVSFTDALGNVTIPIDLNKLLSGGIPDNIQELLAGIADGTTLNITYDFYGLPAQSSNHVSGSGSFAISVKDGGFGAASGNSQIRTGNCTFEFDFADISAEDFAGGAFPAAEAGFDLQLGSNRLLGSVVFDGTDIAEFHGSLDNGPLETIRFDLKTGLTLR